MEINNIPYWEIFNSSVPNKKILLLHPNADLHSQLQWNADTTEWKDINNLNDIISIRNTRWDYIITHAYMTRQPYGENGVDYHFSDFKKYGITCNTLIVDELGEGMSIGPDVIQTFDDYKLNLYLKANRVVWLAPFEDYSTLEEKYPYIEFFKSKLTGPRFFCSKSYRIIHAHKKEENDKVVVDEENKYGNHLVAGLWWKPELKKKLFMSLNNEIRPHRALLCHFLKQENLIEKGYVSFLKLNEYNDEKIIRMDNGDGVDIEKNIDIFKLTLPWENEINNHDRFGLQIKAAEESYIDVVTESSTGFWPFKTEKCMKPFYNLQFPIIYGHEGIVNDLREIGFDMFDDIINHDYDVMDKSDDYIELPFSTENLARTAYDDYHRIPKLTKELKRLSTLNIGELYENNKERFIKNQELVWDLTIKNNNLLYEVGDFVFGKDIWYRDTHHSKLKKIYLNK